MTYPINAGSFVEQRQPIPVYPANFSQDAFGRARMSTPQTQIDLKQLYDGLPLFYDEAAISGTGTAATFNTNKSSTTLSVAASTAGKHAKQSKQRGYYQPGKGILVDLTAVCGTTGTGVVKRWGYFDEKNGLFWQNNAGQMGVGIRTYTSGSAVDTIIPQSSWNVDKLNGTGKSGITLNPAKSNIYVIDFEWLGVGGVRFWVVIDNELILAHQVYNANNTVGVYMTSPNLPIRYEIENDGNGDADGIECICATIIAEGGTDDVSQPIIASRMGTPRTLANADLYTPLVSVRLKSDRTNSHVVPTGVDVFLSTTDNYHWILVLNPTVAGTDAASWTHITNSAIEYDVTRDATNTISGGYIIASGCGSSTAQSPAPINASIRSHLTIGSNIDGSADELVLAVANIDANGGTAYGTIELGEYT